MIAYLAVSIFNNMQVNLEAGGITSGFDFLDDTAGFSIIMHLIPYEESSTYFRAFWVGLLNTLLVSAVGIIIATILGFIVGVGRLSSNWLIRTLCGIYVETLRNIPLLLQIFFWYIAVLRTLPRPKASINFFDAIYLNNRGFYLPKFLYTEYVHWFVIALVILVIALVVAHLYGLKVKAKTGNRPSCKVYVLGCGLLLVSIMVLFVPPVSGLEYPALKGFNFKGGVVLIPEFLSLLLALSMYTAAFIAEIVRSGILAVPKGQKEAATALGLSKGKVLTLVIIPQALKVILPPLTNQYLNLTKNSSLASASAYPDLVAVFAGTVLNQTGQAVEVIGITMAVYLFISLSISAMMLGYERFTSWGNR